MDKILAAALAEMRAAAPSGAATAKTAPQSAAQFGAMPTRGPTMLQFRVSVGINHPLYAALAAIPTRHRGAALLRMAKPQIAEPTTRIAAALERIAAAMETQPAQKTPTDPRTETLARAFDD